MPLGSGVNSIALGMPLFIKGFAAASGWMPLYIHGYFASSGSKTLFIDGGVSFSASGHTTLFETASVSISGGSTLYEPGKLPSSGGMTLYEAGHLPASGQTTLFVRGHEHVELGHAFPMYLAADDVPAVSGGFELTVFGTEHSGWFGGVDLSIYSDTSGNIIERHIPLSIKADGPQHEVRNVNLWTAGEPHSAGLGANLTLWNDQSGVAQGVPLFVSGDGVAAGALPYGHGMNLVLKRDPGNAIPLFLATPGTPATTGTSLYVGGSYQAANAAPLAMPATVGGPTEAVRLFTSGW